MVLQELGSKLTSALRRLHTDTVVDKETIKAVVGDICRALLESDVNVQMVMKLRKNVEAKAEALVGDQQDGGRGAGGGAAQQRRSIQKAVVDELTGMLDPKSAPYKMKKGKSNVVMFVGLQVGVRLCVCRRREKRLCRCAASRVVAFCHSYFHNKVSARRSATVPRLCSRQSLWNTATPGEERKTVLRTTYNTTIHGEQQACVDLLCPSRLSFMARDGGYPAVPTSAALVQTFKRNNLGWTPKSI